MQTAIDIILFMPLACLVVGSLLSLSSRPHWIIRGWDFPRVQVVVIGWLCAGLAILAKWLTDDEGVLPNWAFYGPAVGLTFWHGFRIIPYTPIYPKQAKSTSLADKRSRIDDPATIRMVVSNVEMENDRYEMWTEQMMESRPDILVALEVNEAWISAVESLMERYPYRIIEPQDNWYGMMMLSRFPITSYHVRHLVEDDIPSIDAQVQLDDGQSVRVIAVHPRPPEPWHSNDATARDAELTLWGDELIDEDRPTIIGGDLNDVAWSATTRLFLRTSGMLDPRRGRGFFNTFHANHWYLRFPLDHIFHSSDFTVSRVERLTYVGSDHFPMLIDLRLEPRCKEEHEVLEKKAGDKAEVQTRIDRAKEDNTTNGEAVSGRASAFIS